MLASPVPHVVAHLAKLARLTDNPFEASPEIAESDALAMLMADAEALTDALADSLGSLYGIYQPEVYAPVGAKLAALACLLIGPDALAAHATAEAARYAAIEAEPFVMPEPADLVGSILHADGTPFTLAEIEAELTKG